MEEKVKITKRKTYLITGLILITVILIIVNVLVSGFDKNEVEILRTIPETTGMKDTIIDTFDSLWKNTEFSEEIPD